MLNLNMIPIRVCHDKSLSYGAILLYGKLFSISMMERNGFTFQEINKQGKPLNATNRTIHRWIKELTDNDYIIVQNNLKTNLKNQYFVSNKPYLYGKDDQAPADTIFQEGLKVLAKIEQTSK